MSIMRNWNKAIDGNTGIGLSSINKEDYTLEQIEKVFV